MLALDETTGNSLADRRCGESSDGGTQFNKPFFDGLPVCP
jgi:hypothetical protein